MKKQSYSTDIEIGAAPELVFNRLLDIPRWWTTDYEGSCGRLGDEFVICHPGSHYSRQKLVELIPNQKLVWLVTESKMDWLERDQQEWTGTKMIFEMTAQGDKTLLHFTHEGLVPEKECYERCTQYGWGVVLGKLADMG